ncbi:pachytene checkpoint 2 protein isoform X1 [Tachypleus tridentatus]|uniref:pachytene checkpoint 2 protein isoform X1 n=1 Tax=Tachypleus tridentatus TaxID=6853 RepID=UPI003FD468D7
MAGDSEVFEYVSEEMKVQSTLHVEIILKSNSTWTDEYALQQAKRILNVTDITEVNITDFERHEERENIESISICDGNERSWENKECNMHDVHKCYYVYRLNSDGPQNEDLESEELSAADHWILPCRDFHGLWESLIYDTDIKSQLLNFVTTTLLFSEKNVNPNVITWNRVVLLHGPPGTGKTSLCKALAQKITIRLNKKYCYGQLIEINSHSLFSKWFSESGKLVMKMFTKIQELIDDPEALVFVLIDEVESLAHARKASFGGTEPSDAIRVVNALLNQIDHIRRYPNVIILTTSNVTEAIDLAFVDRADIKQYIGLPSMPAIYQIYKSCIEELQRTGILYPDETITSLRSQNYENMSDMVSLSNVLQQVARKSVGLSGRTLRKLPFLAYALYIQILLFQRGVTTLRCFLPAPC